MAAASTISSRIGKYGSIASNCAGAMKLSQRGDMPKSTKGARAPLPHRRHSPAGQLRDSGSGSTAFTFMLDPRGTPLIAFATSQPTKTRFVIAFVPKGDASWAPDRASAPAAQEKSSRLEDLGEPPFETEPSSTN